MTKANHYKNYFLSHRNVTNELINKISKEDYDYKPTETSQSAKDLSIHMLDSFHMFASLAAQQEPKKLHDDNDKNIDLTELANAYTEQTVALLESLSDDQFAEEIDVTHILGTKVSAEQLINLAIDHEINHKGNLFVYVREMGHTDLPLYVSLG